jgi:hypothetical protein
MQRPGWLYTPGAGFVFAAVLLAVVEAYLHTDAFLYRYRSVFAVGRAMDKLRFVESHVPPVLIVGNSRVDNAFDPMTLQAKLPWIEARGIFNLGMPGADARTLYGILARLNAKGLLGPRKIDRVVIGLDESFLQGGDSLGYGVFFANRTELWDEHEYLELARSWIRLWGFSDNFKELREPAKLEHFISATFHDVEPLGGGARAHLGYRAGFGGLQNAEQAAMQEAGSTQPPNPVVLGYFWRCLDLLSGRSVRVVVTFPPLLNRDVLYISPSDPASAPYLHVAAQIAARGIPVIALDPGGVRSAGEFVNAGHLNDRGAQRFSRMLARKLGKIWPPSAFKEGR